MKTYDSGRDGGEQNTVETGESTEIANELVHVDKDDMNHIYP
jgi:hypothetical protein